MFWRVHGRHKNTFVHRVTLNKDIKQLITGKQISTELPSVSMAEFTSLSKKQSDLLVLHFSLICIWGELLMFYGQPASTECLSLCMQSCNWCFNVLLVLSCIQRDAGIVSHDVCEETETQRSENTVFIKNRFWMFWTCNFSLFPFGHLVFDCRCISRVEWECPSSISFGFTVLMSCHIYFLNLLYHLSICISSPIYLWISLPSFQSLSINCLSTVYHLLLSILQV